MVINHSKSFVDAQGKAHKFNRKCIGRIEKLKLRWDEALNIKKASCYQRIPVSEK